MHAMTDLWYSLKSTRSIPPIAYKANFKSFPLIRKSFRNYIMHVMADKCIG